MTIAALLSSTGNLAFTISTVWARIMLAVTGVRPRIRNREKIKAGQSYIIISNHQSDYDILALVTTMGIQFRWVIKKELRKVPFFGYALYVARNIFIDRTDNEQDIRSIRDEIDRLLPGVSVMVFAEGTRSCDGRIRAFKKDGFMMAVEKGLRILPVTVNGGRRVLPKKSLVFHPGPIEAIVSDPIDTTGYTHATLPDLMEKTRNTIIANFRLDFPNDDQSL